MKCRSKEQPIMSNIVDAEFTSVWDGGYAITTSCKINTDTREIFDIERVDSGIDDLGSIDNEYVKFNGKEHDAACIDDIPDGNTKLYWYK